MRSIKGWIPTAVLTVAILLGATGANAGVITAGRASTDSCQTSSNTGVITAGFADGVITAGFTGVITAGFADGVITAGFLDGVITAGFKTGIIVTDRTSTSTSRCGIIVTD